MKKRKTLLATLALSLAMLANAAFNSPVAGAGLYCSDLKGCSGEAGCSNSGSSNGCKITCGDGTSVECKTGGSDDDGMLID